MIARLAAMLSRILRTLLRWTLALGGLGFCPRCGVLLDRLAAESCWYCGEPLCLACWEALGHCGHPEAQAINDEGHRA